MTRTLTVTLFALGIAVGAAAPAPADDPPKAVKRTAVLGPGGVALEVRMAGPYPAGVTLQVGYHLTYTRDGVGWQAGAPVELDKRLGGLITALRERGEFAGDELETAPADAPKEAIAARRLLPIGPANEKNLSLDLLGQVGKAGLWEAVRLGATRAAFAPLIRDQGDTAIPTGGVETAVTRGVLLAHDTERLQKPGFAMSCTLESWAVEAGPAHCDETLAGVRKAVAKAADAVTARDAAPYSARGR